MNDKNKNIAIWLWLLVALLVMIAVSCTRKVYVPVERTHTVVQTVTDTVVEVRTPAERVVNVTTDTVSEIHTTYATSTAEVTSGVLHHELVQLARNDSVRVQVVHTHTIDSIPIIEEVEVIKEVTPTWCKVIATIITIIILCFIVLGLIRLIKLFKGCP